ncbi:hypothetical protein JCM8547_005059 [Rhodosporidiobolus lusitaniae]
MTAHDQFYLFGTPISHSLSPTFHNTAFAALSLTSYRFLLHETPSFSYDASVAALLNSPTLGGASVTMPHKIEALSLVHELAEEVKEVGSLNTIVRLEEGRLKGRNTDVDGIREALLSTLPEEKRREKAPWGEGRSAFVIGGGGTTRAAISALSQLSLSPIYLLNRDRLETASIISSPSFATYDLRPLDDAVLDSWTEDDARKIACAVGAIPSFEPETEGEKMVYRCAGRVFEWTGRMEGERPLMEMPYKPHRTLMYALAEQHGWRSIGGIEALVRMAEVQLRAWLPHPPSSSASASLQQATEQEEWEEKLRRAVEKAAEAVRAAAGASA